MPLAVEYSQVQCVFKDLLEEPASALPAAVEKRLQLAMIYGRLCFMIYGVGVSSFSFLDVDPVLKSFFVLAAQYWHKNKNANIEK